MNLPTLAHANAHLDLLHETTVTSSCNGPSHSVSVMDVSDESTFGRGWRGARAARLRGLASPCG